MRFIKSLLKLVLSIVICEFVGVIGSLFTTPAINSWYATLIRPSLAPPNWVFAPVWTILFALMGISLFIIWNESSRSNDRKIAIQVFCVQLLLNMMWSMLFFGLHSIRGALIEIISLWLVIVATMLTFSKVSKLAAYILTPYLVWVSFAFILNFAFWVVNQ